MQTCQSFKMRYLWILILTLASLNFSLIGPISTNAQGPFDDLTGDIIDRTDQLDQQGRLQISQITTTDPDGDGLTTTEENQLGTDPNNVDSDCDYEDDKTEVGSIASPNDTDGDNLIDALESTLADADTDGTNDEADSDTATPQVSCNRFIPFAIKGDESDSTRVEIRIAGGTNVTAVSLKVQSNFIKVDGVQVNNGDFFQLFDDGTHGDRTASDGIWTRNQITADFSLVFVFGSRAVATFNTLKVTDNGVETEFSINLRNSSGTFTTYNMRLGAIEASSVQQTPVQIKENVQTVSNLANIIDPLSSLQARVLAHQQIGQRFYQDFSDDYDFVMFFPESLISDGPAGQFFGAQNDVQNIGRNIFDASATFGSQGKLQGTMFLNFGTNGPTLHEVMHRWAAFGLNNLGFHQCAGGHWGVSGVGEGQLGGFNGDTLVDNGNGTYTVDSFGAIANGGDSVNYAPLELYLAGFADAGTVAPIKIPANVDCGSLDFSVPGKVTFSAGATSMVTIGDIQTEFGGPRNPSFATSQKDFRTAMIIISQYKLNATEMAFFNDWSKIFGNDMDGSGLKSFETGTGGVATMNTKMPVEKQMVLEKILDPTSSLEASSRMTYTITITNGGLEAVDNLTLEDAISSNTTFVSGSAQATPAIIDLTNFPNTTAGFSLNSNSSVSIVYNVDIKDTVNDGDLIKNTVTISAPSFLQVLTDSISSNVGAVATTVYLPVVLK